MCRESLSIRRVFGRKRRHVVRDWVALLLEKDRQVFFGHIP